MATKKKRWVCPLDCGNNSLAPSRFRQDDVRRYCIPCSLSTGKMVVRVCPALETKRARAASVSLVKGQQQRDKAREKHLLTDGTDVRALVKKALALKSWGKENPRVERAVRRCDVDVEIGEPQGSHGRAWTGRCHIHLRKDISGNEAFSLIVHELAHIADYAIRRSRMRKGRRPAHDRFFWSLYLTGMQEVFPELRGRERELWEIDRRQREGARALRAEWKAEGYAASSYDHYFVEWYGVLPIIAKCEPVVAGSRRAS